MTATGNGGRAPQTRVDVVFQVYGKPYQTAVALTSLLEHSGRHIDRIYLILERRQPFAVVPADFAFLGELTGREIIPFVPRFHLGVIPLLKGLFPLLRWRPFRHAIRYQYAWEKSDKDFLFISHNDVLYHGDIVGAFRDRIGDAVAAGEIGQCWNCPAAAAGRCSGEHYLDYRPDRSEFAELKRAYPGRRRSFENYPRGWPAWPLPECRVNEWACLVNLKLARPLTMPFGTAAPFGLMRQDIGTRWFYDVHRAGARACHVGLSGLAEHGWATGHEGGHFTLSDREAYVQAEVAARSHLEEWNVRRRHD